MKKPRYKWMPLQRSYYGARPEAIVADAMRTNNVDRETALKILDDYDAQCQVWVNDLYQVQTRPDRSGFLHINIRRRDGGPILRDWRHFQTIKNEIVGPECEAVELYPAESRLVDTTNKYHMYAATDPTFRFPIGMEERDVDYETRGDARGLRQRSL